MPPTLIARGRYEMLMALKQENFVIEYMERFEHLSAPLHDASKECLMGILKSGLKPRDSCGVLIVTH